MNARDESYLLKKGFEFRDIIGAGGSGVVYRIYDPAYHCEFALKSIFRSKFNQSEIDIMNKLEDSNLVRLYNYEFYEDSVYLLMEYCPTSLHDILRQKKRLSFEQLRKYSIGILKAVKACHSNKIAHKDIKPANFLIDQYDRIRLCDFGLSSVQLDSALDKNFVGSVPFMAPEILMRKPHDAFKTDIWAVGVTFFIMATGMLQWQERIALLYVIICYHLLLVSNI
ncbi:CAMK family protein kinase [Trichomonas vaginalis G3]|uniref:CAMK family protein kinase n=1 Tax=Trichomonas vaginalis (strain ATCC PRA-98 / G3) TaxID=412133 RepID=A2FDF3_TRIV3|nr:protein serine/threonine kinase protein [Trichomonas vaginalis G3]EAX97067.1 CAMK family protein kinase [Trichomonas vaginalis G3]KAI5507956.1 protein serine/threonine kinase protein [Trichomonas vaginalis G3]|eukprot:XP_001309997.1 CAMK family protein kinase [Trichomonas vaginalis G3]